MSELRVYPEYGAAEPILHTRERERIAEALKDEGVRFEQWNAGVSLNDEATEEQIIAAYQGDIDRLKREGGYQSVDVVHMHPDHPEREAFRAKFLEEHTHGEDEIRFFVRGQGLFSLHLNDRVFEVLCERGDLIGVPAHTPHWFDMGPSPRFTAIRLFTTREGWVAEFTGSDIAGRFNRLEAYG